MEQKQIIEENAKDAPVRDVLWNASQLATDPIKLEDTEDGGAVVIRHFFFKARPVTKDIKPPTKQDIFNENIKLIEINLWADGFRVRDEKPPEIHTRASAKRVSKPLYQEMVKNKADFVILVLASPRRGQWVKERPASLNLQ